MALVRMVSEAEYKKSPFTTVVKVHDSQTLYLQTTHVGLVLSLGERNGMEDSDFYAIVWNLEKAEPEYITYATTRCWTYSNSAQVDATESVKAAYQAYNLYKQAAARAKMCAEESQKPRVGREVRVVRGRKVPKGTTGRIFWHGENQWGESVGIETLDGKKVFTAAKNVDVLGESK